MYYCLYIYMCVYVCVCVCVFVCLFFVLCAIYFHRYYVFKIHYCAYNIYLFPVFGKSAGMPQAVRGNLVEHAAWWTLLESS
jgi:hypothetical protein